MIITYYNISYTIIVLLLLLVIVFIKQKKGLFEVISGHAENKKLEDCFCGLSKDEKERS